MKERDPLQTELTLNILLGVALIILLVLGYIGTITEPPAKQEESRVDSLGNYIIGKDTFHLPPLRRAKDY